MRAKTERIQRGSQQRIASPPIVDVHVKPGTGSTLARDVREGLSKKQKSLPPKHFYDERGSRLFDEICKTPEYYQTRTELSLLRTIADEIVCRIAPDDPEREVGLVELGSGAARKTRCLLDAASRHALRCVYIPFDVSEEMLRSASSSLQRDYSWLPIHGVVGDYDRHLDRIPHRHHRLFVFLGGTIGNFEEEQARAFLRRLSATMGPADRLLMGTDLLKDTARLNAAYNDRQGLTAEFNKNVLLVINRELGADFDLDRFEHVAFFHDERRQIEMHLRSKGAQLVRIPSLQLDVSFDDGETIHTEISRKFDRAGVEQLYSASGLRLESWHVSADAAFALSVARPA